MTAAVATPNSTGTFLTLRPAATALVIAAAAIVLVWYISQGPRYNVGALYAGTLSMLAIFSGFLATFYVFVATRSNAFLATIRHTRTFQELTALLRFTLLWSLGTCVLTLVLSVAELRNFEPISASMGLIGFWTWAVSMIAVNFWRCARMFIRIVEVTPSE